MAETQKPEQKEETLTEAELIEAVRKQIEYYFSKENLQNDPFLTSQMDANMSVPIAVVMKFAKLKALTQDEDLVRRSLEESSLSVIEDRIKANIKATGRSTIILREIPSDAPAEEVEEIFKYEGSKPVLSLRSEIGDTWFVVMEKEEDAKDTLLDLRLKKRMFRGKAVKGRLKTESVVRSFYPVQTAPPITPVFPVMPYSGMMGPAGPMPIDLRAFGYMGIPPPPAPPILNPLAPGMVPVMGSVLVEGPTEAGSGEGTEKKEDGRGSGGGGSSGRKGSGRGNNNNNNSNSNNNNERSRQGRKGGQGHKDGNNKGGGGKEATETKAPPAIEINVVNFPPLSAAEEGPVPTPGYKDKFHKYSVDEVIAIAKQVKDASLPPAFSEVAAKHPVALTAQPNLDLLHRQRSFSIDETRAQLRQGKPVQKEAILSGAVDMRSLAFGDDQAPAGKTGSQKQSQPSNKATSTPVSSETMAMASATAVVAATLETTLSAVEAQDKGQTPSAGDTHVLSAAAGASPQKITPSTWAAMLRSSAAGTTSESSTQTNGVYKGAGKSSARKAGKGSAGPKAGAGKEKEKEGGSRDRRRSGERGKGPKENGVTKSPGAAPGNSNVGTVTSPEAPSVQGEGSAGAGAGPGGKGVVKKEKGAARVGDSAPASPDRQKGEKTAGYSSDSAVVGTQNRVTPSEFPSTADLSGASGGKPAAGWGGKTSFANVLKQKTEVAGGSVAEPVTKNENKTNSEHLTKPTSTASQHTRRPEREKDGMWVKETLPAK